MSKWFASGFALLCWVLPAAAPPGWHKTLDDGVVAARKSGKALLVATAWSNEQ